MVDLQLPDFVGNIQRTKQAAMSSKLLGLQVREYPKEQALNRQLKQAQLQDLSLRMKYLPEQMEQQKKLGDLSYALNLHKFGVERMKTIDTPKEWNIFHGTLVDNFNMAPSYLPLFDEKMPLEAFEEAKEELVGLSFREQKKIEHDFRMTELQAKIKGEKEIAAIQYPPGTGRFAPSDLGKAIDDLERAKRSGDAFYIKIALGNLQAMYNMMRGQMSDREKLSFERTYGIEKMIFEANADMALAAFKSKLQQIRMREDYDARQALMEMEYAYRNEFKFNEQFRNMILRKELMRYGIELGVNNKVSALNEYYKRLKKDHPDDPNLHIIQRAIEEAAKGSGPPVPIDNIVEVYLREQNKWMLTHGYIDTDTWESKDMPADEEMRMFTETGANMVKLFSEARKIQNILQGTTPFSPEITEDPMDVMLKKIFVDKTMVSELEKWKYYDSLTPAEQEEFEKRISERGYLK